ncbi:hypothetical protein HYV86_03380 [Candidatus Woesearchaeota archaeon]|nr:hypothetical protein [Candidatus Woesearchaeota archaeon]
MRSHLITNFPKNYPFYKKIIPNIIYFVTGIVIQKRSNLLTRKDQIQTRFHLRRGDILLLGNLHELSAPVIGGALTHATLYIGRKKCIEAVGTGVRYSTLDHIFTTYDTLVILRLPKKTKHKRYLVRHAIKFAKAQLGKAYDWDFSQTKQGYFCSKLVNESYRAAGYKTKLTSSTKPRSFFQKIVYTLSHSITALRPEHFIYGNFELIFMSHNLTRKGKKILLKDQKSN